MKNKNIILTIKNFHNLYFEDTKYPTTLPLWISPKGKVYYCPLNYERSKQSWMYLFAGDKMDMNPYDAGKYLADKGWARINPSHGHPGYSWYIMFSSKGLTTSQQKTLKRLGLELTHSDIYTDYNNKTLKTSFGTVIIDKSCHSEYVKNLQENFRTEIEFCTMDWCEDISDKKDFEEIDDIDVAIKLCGAFIAYGMEVQYDIMHKRLCKLLKIDYATFNPFVDVKNYPTQKDAEKILRIAVDKLKEEHE